VPRILVTGGFGFIGTHLVESLCAKPENSVHVVDNLSTSPVEPDPFVDEVGRPANLTWDICSVEQYHADLSSGASFDQIYHLASAVGPVGVLSHAGKLAPSIVNDTIRIIDLALKTGARIVDVSTSEVYGGGRDGYCSENDFKIVPPKVSIRLEYAVAKLAAEVALINTTKVTPLQAAIVRPFNVAGPRQSGKGGFVLPRFVQQALAGEPITVYGDGSMIRAFTHVKDIVDGCMLVMEKGRTGEAYNIGNPHNKTSILDLAQRVVRLANSRSKISFVDPKQLFGPLFEEANDKYPDADLAMRELTWNPRFDLDATIRDTIEYIAGHPTRA
jgi:nucleoside-diphosphate-sugar epimerase